VRLATSLPLHRGHSARVEHQHHEFSDELAHLDERHERKAEPQAEHSAEIRYVLDRLCKAEQIRNKKLS